MGKYFKKGVKNKRVTPTIPPVTTHVSPVLAPDLRLTAVLLKLHATQYPPNRLEERLASHCPINSLLVDNLFFVVYDTNFATEIDSVNHIRPMIVPNNASRKRS